MPSSRRVDPPSRLSEEPADEAAHSTGGFPDGRTNHKFVSGQSQQNTLSIECPAHGGLIRPAAFPKNRPTKRPTAPAAFPTAGPITSSSAARVSRTPSAL